MSLLENPASTITTGRKTVTTAATEVQLSTDNSRIISVAIQAETDNTGNIAVGDANVVAATGSERGIVLDAGDTISLNIDQLSKIWIDSTVNGDGVTFVVLKP